MTTFNDTYEIKGLIGKGGMSTVYLAEHKRLHTRWAVKEVLKKGVQFDFLAESNILKRLQHPMLPRIVDIFEDAQCIYIVEDFVEGMMCQGGCVGGPSNLKQEMAFKKDRDAVLKMSDERGVMENLKNYDMDSFSMHRSHTEAEQ